LLDDYYDIAYDNFVPVKGEGLVAAGLSAEHEAMASARVTAQCFSYGQAIGMAAVLCVHGKRSPRALNVSDLQDALRKDGAVI
jgi:FAD dependent oxidoreductase